MEPRRQKIIARVLLLVAWVAGATWLLRLDFASKIPTDVLELVPKDERVPELVLLRSLAGEQEARVALFSLRLSRAPEDSPESREQRRVALANSFENALKSSGAFSDVTNMRDTAMRDELGRRLFEDRLNLLAPRWLATQAAAYAKSDRSASWPEWLAQSTVARLDHFLGTPEAVPFQDLLGSDPLLLVPDFVSDMGDLASTGANASDAHVLFWAKTNESPFLEDAQRRLFAAMEIATTAARAIEPQATVEWTAVARFAAESRRRIKSEMSALNAVSLLAVLGIAVLGVRRVPKVLHLVPVVGCAFLGAWVITTMTFSRVHVLVFVVGSLLGGVAIDYGFYLYLQPRREGELYLSRARRLLKPLLASALTTVLGFSLLLFSELPLIRQLGLFVTAGLLCALVGALVWFAQIDDPILATRGWVRARMTRETAFWRRSKRVILLAGTVIAVVGPWRLRWHDDIRDLEIPSPTLRANDAALRERFGQTSGRSVYLTRGDSPASARTALESFRRWHDSAFPDAPAVSLGFAVPTSEEWNAIPHLLGGLGDFVDDLRRALDSHGYEVESFASFFSAWAKWSGESARPEYNSLATSIAATLRGPTSLFMHVGDKQTWFASMAPHPQEAEAPPETATVSAGQLQTFNHLFGRYRASAMRLSGIGLGLVGASVFLLYGWKRGVRIFALPLGACLTCFGLFGILGMTLNLFHLLGAFLGVCLSHNYAIFSAENDASGEPPPPSIRFSALTTAASFGVLAFSQIPVVASLGITVATIVLLALFMVEAGVVSGGGSGVSHGDILPVKSA